MTEHRANDVRQQLRRLILDGLKGRKLEQLFEQLKKRFEERGEKISAECFKTWIAGTSFPASLHRQKILAEVVGGPCGEAILKLAGPAFRGWRRRVMKEEVKSMKDLSSKSMKQRSFPYRSAVQADGKRVSWPVITCAECGKVASHPHYGLNAEDVFRKKGWEVGNNERHDYCPECVAKRARKVVKMEDHVKPETANSNGQVLTKEDGRIMSRLIDDRWDSAAGRYQPGWSDQKMADDTGKPLAFVKEIRERDFGGVGEDPGLLDFLRAQVDIERDMGGLRTMMDQLAASVSELGSQHDKVQRLLEKYRDSHNALSTKAKSLGEIASKLGPQNGTLSRSA